MNATPNRKIGHRCCFLPYTTMTKPIPPGISERNSHTGSSVIATMIRGLYSPDLGFVHEVGFGLAGHSFMITPMQKLLVVAAALGGAALVTVSAQTKKTTTAAASARAPFTVVEATIPEMQAALEQRARHLARARAAVPHAHRAPTRTRCTRRSPSTRTRSSEADALDRERAQGKIRGPLHGIPIALKDNIHTTDMPTTGGALAFDGPGAAVRSDADEEPARRRRDHHRQDRADRARQLGGRRADADAGQLQRGRRLRLSTRTIRAAIRARRPSTAARRCSTGGSSSGIGTAANFWAGNVGTETSGSILSPSNQNMLVGIKPTVGRISRYGVIPITADQDTAGPMAKTVTDAAIMLGALESAAPDPNDPATHDVHAAAGPRLHEVPASATA